MSVPGVREVNWLLHRRMGWALLISNVACVALNMYFAVYGNLRWLSMAAIPLSVFASASLLRALNGTGYEDDPREAS